MLIRHFGAGRAWRRVASAGLLLAAAEASIASVARGQAAVSSSLDSLVGQATTSSPSVVAARRRAEAMRARIRPEALFPDPILSAGIVNLPLGEPAFRDFMTMKMVGITQAVPWPGKLSLRRRVAEHEAGAAEAALASATLQVASEVRGAWYELAFLDRALEIVAHNQSLLVNLLRITESRYGVGTAGQQDVLKARVEVTRLAESAAALTEQRRAVLARLNAALDRPSDTPVEPPSIPTRVRQAAVDDSAAAIRFASAALGARAAGSPLPPLLELQELAMRESPMLREQDAIVAAQAARAEAAGRESRPDIELSLQYGQRSGFADMLTAMVSLPIPLQKGRRQDALATGAVADLAAQDAERAARRNEVRAEVARLHAALERDRTQLALYVKAIIPQGRAALASATASYQVGKVEFLTVLENQATLFRYETEYFRLLTDFATALAELERVVGKEMLK